MSELIWIIDANKSEFLGKDGISRKYIIPGPLVNFPVEKFSEATIWIVLRGSAGDRLQSSLKVDAVERFIDGYYKGDYLLWCDHAGSFRVIGDYSEGAHVFLGDALISRTGLSVVNGDPCGMAIRDTLQKSINFKLLSPNEKILDQIGKIGRLPTINKTVREYMALIASKVTLNQIWGSGGAESLSPISNFCYALMKQRLGEQYARSALHRIIHLDPVRNYLSSSSKDSAAEDAEWNDDKEAVSVDLNFSKIEPNTIYAREFVTKSKKAKLLEEALLKTEQAEQAHQDMLRDISQYLLGINKTPLQSSSIDLLLREDVGQRIFEIKSTNSGNVLAQAAKGLFQLAVYQKAIIDNGESLTEKALIISKISNDDMEQYVKSIAKLMGTTLYVYDKSKKWPNKISEISW